MEENFLMSAIGLYCLLLVIFGTIGNIFIICFCLRRRLRHYTTFIFILFMCITDTLSLYVWCLDHFLESFFGFTIEELSPISCRIGFFIQFFSLQSSSWLLVSSSMDRYLGVRIKQWRSIYFKANQALFCSFSIIGLSLIANSQLLVLGNDFEIHQCYSRNSIGSWIDTWKQIHSYVYSIVPSVLLILINSILFYITWKKSMSINVTSECIETTRNRKKKFGLVITIFTFGFMFTTLPSAIITGFFYTKLNSHHETKIYIYICDAIAFSFHSSKFIVLFLCNTNFKREIMVFAQELLAKMKQKKNYTNNCKSVTESSF